jgi:hypothetical protein
MGLNVFARTVEASMFITDGGDQFTTWMKTYYIEIFKSKTTTVIYDRDENILHRNIQKQNYNSDLRP